MNLVEEIEQMNRDMLKAVEVSLDKIEEIMKSNKYLFIQVISKYFFKKDATLDEMGEIIADKISDSYDTMTAAVNWAIHGDSVIVMGLAMPDKEE